MALLVMATLAASDAGCATSKSTLVKKERREVTRTPLPAREGVQTSAKLVGSEIQVAVGVDCSERVAVELTNRYEVERTPKFPLFLGLLAALGPAVAGGVSMTADEEPLAGTLFGAAGALVLLGVVSELSAIDGTLTEVHEGHEVAKRTCPLPGASVRLGSLVKKVSAEGVAVFAEDELMQSESRLLVAEALGADGTQYVVPLSAAVSAKVEAIETKRAAAEEARVQARAERTKADEKRRADQAREEAARAACEAIGADYDDTIPDLFAKGQMLPVSTSTLAGAPSTAGEPSLIDELDCVGPKWGLAWGSEGPQYVARSELLTKAEKVTALQRVASEHKRAGRLAEAVTALREAQDLVPSDEHVRAAYEASVHAAVNAVLRQVRAARMAGRHEEALALLDQLGDTGAADQVAVAAERDACQKAIDAKAAAERRRDENARAQAEHRRRRDLMNSLSVLAPAKRRAVQNAAALHREFLVRSAQMWGARTRAPGWAEAEVARLRSRKLTLPVCADPQQRLGFELLLREFLQEVALGLDGLAAAMERVSAAEKRGARDELILAGAEYNEAYPRFVAKFGRPEYWVDMGCTGHDAPGLLRHCRQDPIADPFGAPVNWSNICTPDP